MPDAAPPAAAPDPQELLRSRSYIQILILAALAGLPISAVAYGFLVLVDHLQKWVFEDLPDSLGFASAPTWWPLPLLALSGVLVTLAIRHLPGPGGHEPADGFKTGGALPPVELPGVFFAALATLSLGAVLGPEAPLIAIGSGLGALTVRLAARDAPPTATNVIAATGSFAAISSLLGSPLIGAFLLLEASGLGGPMLGLVLVPGLLASGVGALIFLGLDSITGFGPASLTVPGLPPFDHLTVAMFAYAIAFGLLAPFLGRGITLLARAIRSRVRGRSVWLVAVLGLLIAGLAILFGQATDKPASNVLFSGQSALGPLLENAGSWSVGALLLLVVCKGLAYAISLSSFRGGPIFPAMFIGGAAGVAASHLPGLDLIPAVAMGIGAMSVVMLTLPFTSVLLATLLLGSDGVQAMPLAIVAVVVAYVMTARLTPLPATEDDEAQRRERPATAPTSTPITVTR